ncbi:maleylacetoacetate isomerase [Rhizobium leguminosarum bv. viciae]|uniref:maleylacetoacetate isomerase n=1 Tax=Rhizobium TaxID=379 RepID=UPI000B8CB9AC|nr:maleylacetoacetate isomerase [Rhizobium leguminosarum]ASR06098.1 maleylacetoacetate isomerase [Rhizobium leguminosarum bv. viciae]NKL96491.1 maleylacetoacetate isomerase [Rhizobium leguminosarum bv. viciae]TBY79123.1 maleylacetoacetate isomerase [Rhizobium leguminosarum bv. viciae]TCA11247.1 maleylacetoacetate isomerase [Rhizobium leguminosarum bv. viciae]UFW80671.1 maleylacetoacetate isomerase [Rhizobium leguminosarum bv. viciae]
MKLYQNEISSATSRVRIALALKGLTAEALPVTILGEDSESRQAGYRSINPQGLVPALLTDSGVLLTQSLAIVEYLDELQPEPPLLPDTAEGRALARSIALAITAEIHALLPPRIGLHLKTAFQADADAIAAWSRHWIGEGMGAVETMIAGRRQGVFVVGDRPSIADIFLFPQAISARRLGFDLTQWPNIAEIVAKLEAIPAFHENAPAPRK